MECQGRQVEIKANKNNKQYIYTLWTTENFQHKHIEICFDILKYHYISPSTLLALTINKVTSTLSYSKNVCKSDKNLFTFIHSRRQNTEDNILTASTAVTISPTK